MLFCATRERYSVSFLTAKVVICFEVCKWWSEIFLVGLRTYIFCNFPIPCSLLPAPYSLFQNAELNIWMYRIKSLNLQRIKFVYIFFMSQEIQFLLYNLPDEEGKVQVVIKDETIWCTQKAMSVLFGCSVDYFRELLDRVRSIRASERRIWQQITDIYAECWMMIIKYC